MSAAGKPLSARCARKFGRDECAMNGIWCVLKGNSLSLSGVCDDRGQLPREGAMYYGTHVVWKSFRPQNSFPCLTILALRQKAPFWPRLRRRRAGSRRRRETEGVAFGRRIGPCCIALAVRYPDLQGNFPERAINDRPCNANLISTKYPLNTKNIYYV